MVNRIKAVDDNGTVCQMFTINDDVKHFGMIQKSIRCNRLKRGNGRQCKSGESKACTAKRRI